MGEMSASHRLKHVTRVSHAVVLLLLGVANRGNVLWLAFVLGMGRCRLAALLFAIDRVFFSVRCGDHGFRCASADFPRGASVQHRSRQAW